ncbi:D-alanyl-D-alanine carboxypeptidase family protein [Aureimonas populi]|uniref:serine-type D-Ala-D-Ala carboxypeptidase n=1 Tax=Aureimonas populi TaxID=1701758 RepID=A0ABW5CP18_9HYPH|nr:D-alanyl-D-alanine carboxypeptidase family protein [Aureimonas populi]
MTTGRSQLFFWAFVAFAAVESTPAAAQVRVAAPAMETSAGQAILIDGETGAVLFEKNADQPFPPASLAKLMTAEVVFNALEAGSVLPSTEYRVSDHAWRTGGAPSRTSTMFAEVRSNVPVDSLLRGLIIQQANDACLILAEGLAGSEAAFVALMNERAGELGLAGSKFVNATGLPAEGQATTVRDVARLSRHLERAYPALYELYGEREFEWNRIRQRNRNPLLAMDIGATGLATGFAEGVGYAIAGAVEREGRTTYIALGGLESERMRSSEARRLLDWAQGAFSRKTLVSAGESVGTAMVFGGMADRVSLVADADFVAYVPNDTTERLRAVVVYDGPLQAPVAEGEKVGRLELRVGERVSLSQDLYAGHDVEEGTFASRAVGAVRELAFGWVRAL